MQNHANTVPHLCSHVGARLVNIVVLLLLRCLSACNEYRHEQQGRGATLGVQNRIAHHTLRGSSSSLQLCLLRGGPQTTQSLISPVALLSLASGWRGALRPATSLLVTLGRGLLLLVCALRAVVPARTNVSVATHTVRAEVVPRMAGRIAVLLAKQGLQNNPQQPSPASAVCVPSAAAPLLSRRLASIAWWRFDRCRSCCPPRLPLASGILLLLPGVALDLAAGRWWGGSAPPPADRFLKARQQWDRQRHNRAVSTRPASSFTVQHQHSLSAWHTRQHTVCWQHTALA